MPDYGKKVAQALLDIKAITLQPEQPFTWASGLKSPIYCDNRLIMSFPKERQLITDAFKNLINTYYSDVEVIAGTATAGIPHAAFIAQALDLPMIYVRSKPKDHGKLHAIEGYLTQGAKVLMIEDLISTGSSVIEAGKQVEAAGGKVIGCAAIFSYLLESGINNFKAIGYPIQTLTHYLELLEVASSQETVAHHLPLLEDWYKDPQTWSNQYLTQYQPIVD